MNRPSKKEIQAAVDKLKENAPSSSNAAEPIVPKPEAKKANKNRIRKQGV